MPLLGGAALLLSFDIAAEAIEDHDDWHTHEHLPERLSIPGFLRGSRWVALDGTPRYLVLYEVAEVETLTSAPYLARLDAPSAWTTRVMPHYRGMSRTLCTVALSAGLGMGHVARLLRFSHAPETAGTLQACLAGVLPPLAQRRGVGGGHLLRRSAAAPMTNEQRLRGADAALDSALLLVGYEAGAVTDAASEILSTARAAGFAGGDAASGLYRVDYTLTAAELAAR